MRKLSKKELVVIAAALVSLSASADEPVPLPTVSVTGTYNTFTSFGWNYSGAAISGGTIPQSLGSWGSGTQALLGHAMDCAKAYAQEFGGGKGPRAGARTFVVGNHGWVDKVTRIHYETWGTAAPPIPAGHAYQEVAGFTSGTDISMIFTPANPTLPELINTLAHEWSHQWGSMDLQNGDVNDAYAIGDKAEQAYLADHGHKCGE